MFVKIGEQYESRVKINNLVNSDWQLLPANVT